MKRPWQIWLLFVLCLAIVIPAMAWLTIKALELDRARAQSVEDLQEAWENETVARQEEQIARQDAEAAQGEAVLQELVSSALWRMDSTLTPIIAQESARPHFVSQPFIPTFGGQSGKLGVGSDVSPLLIQPSEFVLLHFQVTPEDQWSSPQTPVGTFCEEAVTRGAPRENINNSRELLAYLSETVGHEDLLAMLPDRTLPAVQVSELPWAANAASNYNAAQIDAENLTITNEIGLPQLAEAQAAAGPLTQRVDQEANPQAGQNPFANEQNVLQNNQSRGPSRGQLATTKEQQAQRGSDEWMQRKQQFEWQANIQLYQQRLGVMEPPAVREGVSRSLWIGPNLLLARRVIVNNQVVIQGCWLNWPAIKAMLLAQIADLFPDADLMPVKPHSEIQPGRMLATLPVRLDVRGLPVAAPVPALVNSRDPAATSALSPIQMSLLVAWGCLLLATTAVAILLRGVMALSERRGAFVSAVTHELRTPLTTFRMYAEMLSEGMVKDAEQQQQYVETLRGEADRLSHLVENVLSYAQLERGNPGKRRERVSVESLIGRVERRLTDRAAQADMQLQIDADEAIRLAHLHTDPAAVEQVLFNLVDNACKYAVGRDDRRIHLEFTGNESKLQIRVRDHGAGISPKHAKRLFQPFSKSCDEAAVSAPGVGLGLALSRRLASALGGTLELDTTSNDGAVFLLTLPRATD